MPYAIMRFQKCAAGGVAAKNRHNERLKSEYKSNPNIDRDRTKNNYHLVEPQQYRTGGDAAHGIAGVHEPTESTGTAAVL